MKIKEDLYSYNYRDGRVASVEKNGKSVLEIKRDAITGEVTGLALPGTWETIGLAATAERPVVESIGGKSVVSRVEKTLGEATPASGGGGKVTFEQAINGELNPTIKLGDQLIAWNPATKKIAKDGEWTYDIKLGAGPFDNAAIGRENARNQSEFWHRDSAKGQETTRDLTGKTTIKSWFTSGNLNGKTRSLVLKKGGVSTFSKKYTYDESGNIKRVLKSVFDRDASKQSIAVDALLSKDEERTFIQKKDGTVEYSRHISHDKMEVFIVKNGKMINRQLKDLMNGEIIKNKDY